MMPDRLGLGHRPVALDPLAERLAVDELHDQERASARSRSSRCALTMLGWSSRLAALNSCSNRLSRTGLLGGVRRR